MKSSSLFAITLLLSVSQLWASETQLTDLKNALMTMADSSVEAEKNQFLTSYGLNASHLNNQDAIDDIKSSHDHMVDEELINNYQSETDQIDNNETELVQKTANTIFKECNADVKIINNSTFALHQIGVFQHNKTKVCYVELNVAEHVKNLEQLAEILRHESSHIIYQDNFNKELLQCIAWTNSNDDVEVVEEKIYPFCRSFELRADVYAAVNSTDNGGQLIAFLKTSPKEDDSVLTHPKNEQRIAFLEKVKSELDAAAALNNNNNNG